MKYLKKWLSLLLAGALIVTSLTACGAGTAYISVLIDQMQSQLTNMTVERDAELQRALQVVAGSGSTDETVLTQDLIKELNLTDVVPFTLVGLRNARAGSSAVDVVYREGNNPNAAIDSAATRWLDVLRYLHSGRYIVHVALVQKNSSYAFAIHVQVERSGNSGDDNDNDNDNIIDRGYEPQPATADCNSYRIVKSFGLENLVEDLAALDEKNETSGSILTTNIKLECDVTLTNPWKPIGTDDTNSSEDKKYNATFDGNDHTISNLKAIGYKYQGMFGHVGKKGVVQNLTLENPVVDSGIESHGNYAGAVAGINSGTIDNCKIKNAQVEGQSNVGGVAGSNYSTGTIKNCSVIGGTITGSSVVGGVAGSNSNEVSECVASAAVHSESTAGGIVGENSERDCIVEHCTSTGNVIFEGDGTGSYLYGGGIVGVNYGGKIVACYRKSGDVRGFEMAGGIVGRNNGVHYRGYHGEVVACYHSGGNVSAIDYDGSSYPSYAGGIAGKNDSYAKIVACYHSGGNVTITPDPDDWRRYVGGIAGDSDRDAEISACYSGDPNLSLSAGGIKVEDEVTWQDAEKAMNEEIGNASDEKYSGANENTPPTLPEVKPQ